jgi:putative DNA methylase
MIMSETGNQYKKNRLIESDNFAFDFLSAIAERESWRKEIHRPIYHVHKWWAKRLGSVFRGLLLGSVLSEDEELETAFYQKHNFPAITVFDPFMGSGTTVGEAHKLGFTVYGRDINPVACESVRVALGPLDQQRLQSAFTQLSVSVGQRIRELYQAEDDRGVACDVLYYFWVKSLPCPNCSATVKLFHTNVIAQNAYPDRKPEIQVRCPQCGDIFCALHSDKRLTCRSCGEVFDPHRGAVHGAKATCSHCSYSFPIVEAMRAADQPPAHQLYGKLVLRQDGQKRYLPATPADIKAYYRCSKLLAQELAIGSIRLPNACLKDGYNTRQALSYNYKRWRDFFNYRQLLALGWLQDEIAKLPEPATRDALLLLFSGTLEFNNLFASYKGEGTGAVRHMFAHHILKPERMPIEANVWGTPKSSGSFSNLFRLRLLRAVEYQRAPFELTIQAKARWYGASEPFQGKVVVDWPQAADSQAHAIYLSCGSSDQTDLPAKSIDLIVTDPPFFDNVHYSELADFFYAWQQLYPRGFIGAPQTTRHPDEVQDDDPAKFAQKLKRVFAECNRVLNDEGLLVFTYHHSRQEGWLALVEAIWGGGFSIINAHPVKAEMAVAAPKTQAKAPINLDIALVCRKRKHNPHDDHKPITISPEVVQRARHKWLRLVTLNLKLSLNDCRIVVIAQFLATLGPVAPEVAVSALTNQQQHLETIAKELFHNLPNSEAGHITTPAFPASQLAFQFAEGETRSASGF